MTIVNIHEEHKTDHLETMLVNAAAMADALEYYLIEGNIFRTVMVRRTHGLERLTMSIGELLAVIHLLQAKRATMTAPQREQLITTLATFERERSQLHDVFNEMIVREIMARLDSINWFLHDCDNDPDACRATFPSEIRNRQRIEEMVKALGKDLSEDVTDRIERIDERLRNITQPSGFVWGREREAIYTEDPYWYLYRLPA